MVGLQAHIFADIPGVLAKRSDDEGYFKLIGLAIVVVIWIVGAIASAIQKANKKREEELAARRLSGAPNPLAAQPPVVPPVAYMAPPPPLVRTAPPPIPSGAKKKKGSRQQRPASVPPPLEAVASRVELSAVTSPPARQAAAARPALNATTIRRWLTPGVMRKQYLLTELFDPPPSAGKHGR